MKNIYLIFFVLKFLDGRWRRRDKTVVRQAPVSDCPITVSGVSQGERLPRVNAGKSSTFIMVQASQTGGVSAIPLGFSHHEDTSQRPIERRATHTQQARRDRAVPSCLVEGGQ